MEKVNFKWENKIHDWLQHYYSSSFNYENDIISFFEKVFQNTQCKERAWFGVHSSGISLVVGGIYLAAIHKSGSEKGIWMLMDQNPPFDSGLDFRPVKSSQNSSYPLVWAHSTNLDTLKKVTENSNIWKSYTIASEKILLSSVSSDRDHIQIKRRKIRLLDFWKE
jgi:hypothetical protein